MAIEDFKALGHFYKFPEPATLLTCKRAFLILRTATPV